MKHMLYAVFAACSAMLVTSGIVAFATAAPVEAPASVQDDLDALITAQLSDVKHRLQTH